MNTTCKSVLSVLSFFVLSACGGGGGGSSEPPPPGNSPPTSSTQKEIKDVSKIGVAATVTTGNLLGFDLEFLTGLVAALGSDVGGTRVIPLSCITGTANISVAKSASRSGLVTGDAATYTYERCNINSEGLVLNGKVVVSAQGAVVPISAGSFSLDYVAVMTGFSATSNSITRNYNGTLDIISSLVSSTQYASRFSIPTGLTFTMSLTGIQTPLSYIYGPGTTFADTENSTTRSATRKLDGDIAIRVQSAPPATLAISTPAALIGTLSNTSQFAATAGTINTKLVNLNIATSTTFNDANATVRGDTDKNGSLDLTFAIPYAELLAP